MNNLKIKDVLQISIVAAIYIVLTVAVSPLSYGDVQFRVSETLMLLVLYKKRYAISMIIGCLIANLFSPVGAVDVIFGTLATIVAIIPMLFIKNLEISSIFPSISNGIIVGLELAIVYELPIAFTMFTVFLGEFVVVSLIGIPLFRALEKNSGFMEVLDAEPLPSRFNINPYVSLNIAIFILSFVIYIKLALNVVDETYYTLFYNLKHKNYIYSICLPIICFLYLLFSIFFNKFKGLIFDILFILSFIVVFIILVMNYEFKIKLSFYLFIIIPLLMSFVSFVRFMWKIKYEEILSTKNAQIEE